MDYFITFFNGKFPLQFARSGALFKKEYKRLKNYIICKKNKFNYFDDLTKRIEHLIDAETTVLIYPKNLARRQTFILFCVLISS